MADKMQSLFVSSGAVLSECGTYRYRLWRQWDDRLRSAAFICLNPSTADASRDDPTITRCINFAHAWKCGGIEVVNLFAYRATDPRKLSPLPLAEAVGPENDRHIRAAAEQCCPVVLAWGANNSASRRSAAVLELLRGVFVPLHCLKVTKGGHPQHPLFVKGDTVLVPWE